MSFVKRVDHHPQVSPPTFPRPDKVLEPLYLIMPVFNSQRFKSRWTYNTEFIKYALDSGAHVLTIEACFGERLSVFAGTDLHERHTNIIVRTDSELWIKENLQNLAVQALPYDWKYVCFVDPDIIFARKDWVSETIQRLQHYSVVQMFSTAIDLDPEFKPYQFNRGFVYDYQNGIPFKMQFTKNVAVPNVKKLLNSIQNPYCDDCEEITNELKINYYHPGFAWAYRREAFTSLGGLIDIAILGAADSHMASSFLGKSIETIHPQMHEEYKQAILSWEERAGSYIKQNIGFVETSLYHYFHGAKKNRQYGNRWKILTEEQYRISKDLKKNWNGVYTLTDNNPRLRDRIRQYLHSRKEDNMDMEGALGFLD